MPYPRTALCTWSNRGTLLTYAHKKYDFNRIEKNQPKDFDFNKAAIGESTLDAEQSQNQPDASTVIKVSKKLPGTGYDFIKQYEE